MFSALSASSRQDVSTVLGLHSLPETVHFASLPLLGLIRHLHNRKSSLYLQIKFDLNLLFHYTRILCFCQTNCDFISKIVPPARFSSEKDSKITAEQAFSPDLQGALTASVSDARPLHRPAHGKKSRKFARIFERGLYKPAFLC